MKFIFFLTYILLTLVSLQVRPQGGLEFQSTSKSSIANRTSYTVFANDIPKIHNELSISFELAILDPNSFGFISIIGEDASNAIYSLSYVNWNDDISHLKLNLEGEKNLLTIPIDISQLGKGKWVNIRLHFNLQNDSIRFNINNKLYYSEGKKISESMLAPVFFGKHENIIDVPSFAIRNLIINDDRQKFHFPFKENTGNIVNDIKGNPVGFVENPVWLINESFHWKHRLTYTAEEMVAVNFSRTQILIAGKDSIAFFDMEQNTIEKKSYANKLPVPVRLGMSFIADEKLFVYEVNDVLEGYPSIASMDIDSLTWKSKSFLTLDKQRHHHNSYLNTENQKFYIFGGFGNKRLSNSFDCYDIVNDSWNSLSLSGDVITPRFFSGMAELNDQLIVFGGVGNETGDQSIGKKYYSDCYKIDIKNREVKKLWDMDQADENLVSSRNMIISEDSTSFYTLSYPEYIPQTHIKLYQYNIKTGAFVVLGDSIPITSERIRTNANLYLNSQSKEIYCVIQEISGVNDSKISVYSIDNPPVSTEELFVTSLNKKNRKSLIDWIPYLTLIILTFVFFLFWFLRKRKRQSVENRFIKENTQNQIAVEQKVQPQKNSFYIFGIFTVFDRQGKDITHLFSPQVKQLFLLILLKSNNNGVTSEHIYNSIWPDKPIKNAKNLKGVTINKLRKVLADIDGIELLYENQKFKIQNSTSAYCDYLEYKLVYNEISNEINDLNIERIVEITSRGQFLKSVNNDYFDTFKKEVSDQILGIVPLILNQNFTQKAYLKTISIATVLYFSDELNECAFYYIMISYIRLGNKTAAKKHYVDYIIRYKKIQGEDYNVPYREAIANAEKFTS